MNKKGEKGEKGKSLVNGNKQIPSPPIFKIDLEELKNELNIIEKNAPYARD